MDEEQARVAYWDAVNTLRELIESGCRDKESIMEELEDDL